MTAEVGPAEPLYIDHGDMRRAATLALAFAGGDDPGGNHVLREVAEVDRQPEALIAMMELLLAITRAHLGEAAMIEVLAGFARVHAESEADGADEAPDVDHDDEPDADDEPAATPPARHPECGWRDCSRRPLPSAPICPAHHRATVAMFDGSDPDVVAKLIAVAAEKRRPWRRD